MPRNRGRKLPREGAPTPGLRQPVVGTKVPQKKRPIEGAPPYPEEARVVFGLQLLDHNGPWGWTNVTSAEWEKIVAKAKACEALRPSEVFGVGANKQIPTENLCSEASSRLQHLELDDQELWELRVTGKMRIWGIRRAHIFYLLWWDPNHEVCPSNKRNT